MAPKTIEEMKAELEAAGYHAIDSMGNSWSDGDSTSFYGIKAAYAHLEMKAFVRKVARSSIRLKPVLRAASGNPQSYLVDYSEYDNLAIEASRILGE